MNREDAYKLLQKECGLAEGDTVKVLRTAKGYESGWQNSWNPDMNKAVGEMRKIKRVCDSGILMDDRFFYPWFVLELVEKAKPKWNPVKVALNSDYSATVHEDRVEVGCQVFTLKSIMGLAEVVKQAQEFAKS